ncbi:hypothetical protein WG901_22755 [Novosphingobium sp. PS1R-30]|uniref:Uncharacterized protein n=1 Tax=Novosphingobium anseongense TaxID=3133436 RepID=A0ABU8S3F2_9SPHN
MGGGFGFGISLASRRVYGWSSRHLFLAEYAQAARDEQVRATTGPLNKTAEPHEKVKYQNMMAS